VLERFNFKWPAVLDCSRLPDGDADTSQLCIDPPAAVDELDDALGPQAHAPANNLRLRQLLDALRSHNSSSWQRDVFWDSVESRGGAGESPTPRDLTVMTSHGSFCSQRYVMTDDNGSGSSLCRPRCGVDVLYHAHDKRSVSATVYSFIHSFIYSFTHSFTHSLTHSLTHSFIHDNL